MRGKGNTSGEKRPKREEKKARCEPEHPNLPNRFYSRQVDKHRPPPCRMQTVPPILPPPHQRHVILILIPLVFVLHNALRMLIAKHLSINVPVLDETLAAARVLAEEMLGVVTVA